MDKPDSEILEQIVAMIEDLREMENAITVLKNEANSKVALLSNEDNRIESANYLYWLFPEIKTSELSQAIIGKNNVHEFLNTISEAKLDLSCDRCENEIIVKSRTQLNEKIRIAKLGKTNWAEGYTLLCDICKEEIFSEREIKSQEYFKQRADRLQFLKTMPYKDYLQTPEWQSRRLQHLKSSGFRCQVCNSPEKLLDVHHRTYERRGEEYYKDLIVLCRKCHDTFHSENKLSND